jgi:hypothetical protein
MTTANAKAPLGRLVQVDLRTDWAHEALELTPWLEENIGLLSEALGLELEVEERECFSNDPQRSLLNQLRAKSGEVERAIGEPVTWHDPPGTKSAKVYIRRPGNVTDPSEWPVQHRWLKEKLELFHRVFRPIVMELRSEQPIVIGEADSELPD